METPMEPLPESPPPMAMVTTTESHRLRVEVLEAEPSPPGAVWMGSFVRGRLIARCAVHPGTVASLRRVEALTRPVRLAIQALQLSHGLHCRLVAIAPMDRRAFEEADPWLAGLVRGEQMLWGLVGGRQVSPGEECWIPLGYQTRLEEDRRFPADLEREAHDLLVQLLEEEPAEQVVEWFLAELTETA